jgi:hypothetical protein
MRIWARQNRRGDEDGEVTREGRRGKSRGRGNRDIGQGHAADVGIKSVVGPQYPGHCEGQRELLAGGA